MPDRPTVTIEFVKSSLFRSIQVDGAFVGNTPKGGVTLTFFSDRLPIPKVVVHGINPDGTLGDEIIEKRMSKQGVIRDTEISVGMPLDIAKGLIKTLQDIVTKMEELAPSGSNA